MLSSAARDAYDDVILDVGGHSLLGLSVGPSVAAARMSAAGAGRSKVVTVSTSTSRGRRWRKGDSGGTRGVSVIAAMVIVLTSSGGSWMTVGVVPI